MVTLVNSNIEELYMMCQDIIYIGCCISYLLLAAPLFDLYIPPGLEILHNESVLELQRSLGEEYLIIPQNREITLLGCCSSHSLLESHFMSTLFH